MKRALFVGGVLLWTLAVFLVTFRLTFPSQAISDRIRAEVPLRMGDEWSADVGSVAPWWFGLSMTDVKLYKAGDAVAPEPSEDEEGEGGEEDEAVADEPAPAGPVLVAMLRRLALRVSPWSLVRQSPYIHGSLGLTEGQLDFSVGTGVDKRGGPTLVDMSAHGTDLPLADLLAFAGASGDGKLALDLDLHAGETGTPRDADGRLAVHGTGLVLSDLEFPGIGPLGMDVPISDLNLVVDFVDGKGTVSEGVATSELATVSIGGEVTLREPVTRTAFDLTIGLSNLSGSLSSFEGLMTSAKQADGSYQFTCRGTLARIGSASCSMKGSTDRRVGSRGGRRGEPGTASAAAGMGGPAASDEDREKHREEVRERLRQRREAREAQDGVATPGEGGDPPEDEPEDPPLEDVEPTDGDEEPEPQE